MSTSIRTASGVTFDLFQPKAEDVRIADIAHALARLPRYTGHGRAEMRHLGTECSVPMHFSVAEHSVRVCRLAMRTLTSDDNSAREWHWAALLHDAHEAYVGDVTSPLKRAMREFVAPGDKTHFELIEAPVLRAVREALCIDGEAMDAKMREREASIAHLDRLDLEEEIEVALPADWPGPVSLSASIKGLGINSAQAEFLSLAVALAPTSQIRTEAEDALTELVRRVVPATRLLARPLDGLADHPLDGVAKARNRRSKRSDGDGQGFESPRTSALTGVSVSDQARCVGVSEDRIGKDDRRDDLGVESSLRESVRSVSKVLLGGRELGSRELGIGHAQRSHGIRFRTSLSLHPTDADLLRIVAATEGVTLTEYIERVLDAVAKPALASRFEHAMETRGGLRAFITSLTDAPASGDAE